MGELDKQGVVTMQELIASSLAQTDALTKLLIEKGLITKDEFMQNLSAERAVYQAGLRKVGYCRGLLMGNTGMVGTPPCSGEASEKEVNRSDNASVSQASYTRPS